MLPSVDTCGAAAAGGGKAVESDHTDRKLKETFSRLKEPILGFLGERKKNQS